MPTRSPTMAPLPGSSISWARSPRLYLPLRRPVSLVVTLHPPQSLLDWRSPVFWLPERVLSCCAGVAQAVLTVGSRLDPFLPAFFLGPASVAHNTLLFRG